MCTHAAEDAGFDACFVTDHPAPDIRWLEGGGHHTLDPFVALSFAAAATTRLKVQTHILVLPYRNPLLTAKSVLSLDVLSGGRVILGVAPGYLKPEFAALGVNFDERNELTDEAIDVMRTIWTEGEIETEGRNFRTAARRCGRRRRSGRTRRSGSAATARPRSAGRPSAGKAGSPSRTRRVCARSVPHRSPISTSWHGASGCCVTHAASIGRTEPLDICFSPFASGAAAILDEVHTLEELGVTWTVLGAGNAKTRAEWIDSVRRIADEVVAPYRA